MAINPPLTESELKDIAKILRAVERVFGDDSGEKGLTAFGKKFSNIHLEVLRPDDEGPVGIITYYDGWLGFYPKEIS